MYLDGFLYIFEDVLVVFIDMFSSVEVKVMGVIVRF